MHERDQRSVKEPPQTQEISPVDDGDDVGREKQPHEFPQYDDMPTDPLEE